jgi:IS5 family transposase
VAPRRAGEHRARGRPLPGDLARHTAHRGLGRLRDRVGACARDDADGHMGGLSPQPAGGHRRAGSQQVDRGLLRGSRGRRVRARGAHDGSRSRPRGRRAGLRVPDVGRRAERGAHPLRPRLASLLATRPRCRGLRRARSSGDVGRLGLPRSTRACARGRGTHPGGAPRAPGDRARFVALAGRRRAGPSET